MTSPNADSAPRASDDESLDGPDLGRFLLTITVLLLFVAVFTVSDMIQDLDEHPSALHLACEAAIALASLTAFGLLLSKVFGMRRQAGVLGRQLLVAHEDVEKWRREAQGALRGLASAIDAQFGAWRLTPAEKEVGMLLLKGLALKEIAAIRQTSERTVRHQAQEIYRKGGLGGRADFSAFFLEDLLLPAGSGTGAKP